ncbi:MAG TPA: NAD(P)/FAD-dependent oxidoreductase [Anditalea sp.]|nr:NAD(P)/FAD-dependent oxidoreductase [Anditalea sp.]
MNDKRVYIIGAGISGLVAAYELEAVGYRPVILEASSTIGGRLKTDVKDGYLLDRGFQIFLTGYPEAKRYLNYEALNLKYFDGDMVILRTDGTIHVTDPLKNPAGILSMAFSKVGNMKDKIKLLQMVASVLGKSDEEIFSQPDLTTEEYFLAKGFSPEIIFNFLNPLYRGIFLEERLFTSSNMFEYVFKMFNKGKVGVPELGMQEIPNQLFGRLKQTELRLNTKVTNIDGGRISIENADGVDADEIICACDPDYFTGQLKDKYDKTYGKKYHKVTNIYYAIHRSFIAKPILGLVPGENFLINNLHFPTDISSAYSTTGKALLSVTIVKDINDIENIEEQVAKELQELSGIDSIYFEHIHTYKIDKALPIIELPHHDVIPTVGHLSQNIHLAGDHLVNASLNGAMVSGRRAAESIILNHTLGKPEHLEPLSTTQNNVPAH